MPNTVTITANKANTTKAIEYSLDGGTTWQDGNVFTGVPAGVLPAGTPRARLKGSNPAIVATWNAAVTVASEAVPGTATQMVFFGDSNVFGFLTTGGPSATTPPGATDGSFPDQLLRRAPAGSLTVHNLGVSGNNWATLQGRVSEISTYINATTKPSYAQRIVAVMAGTNPAWHDGMNGFQSATAARSLIDSIRAAVPSDVKIWLYTVYPFNYISLTPDENAGIDTLISQYNAIALNQDTTNSELIGLYAAVDKVLNVRTQSAFATMAAFVDRSITSDGVHPTTLGNVVPSELTFAALSSPDKVVNSDYEFPPAPYGTPFLGTPEFVPLANYKGTQGMGENADRQISFLGGSGSVGGAFNLGMRFRYPVAAQNGQAPFAEFGGTMKFYIKNGTAPERLVATVTTTAGVTRENDILFEDHPNGGANQWRVESTAGLTIFNDMTVEYYY